jgi:hypothetical protein
MDAWGSQAGSDAQRAPDAEDNEWEVEDKGKDALIVLVDARANMFAPYADSDGGSATAPATWFHAVLTLLVKLLKSKVVAGDNSLLSVVLFGSVRAIECVGMGRGSWVCSWFIMVSPYRASARPRPVHWSMFMSCSRSGMRLRSGSSSCSRSSRRARAT